MGSLLMSYDISLIFIGGQNDDLIGSKPINLTGNF